MRTLVVALLTIAAVGLGALVGRSEAGLAFALALGSVALGWAWARGSGRDLGRDLGRDGGWVVALLLILGLARGASSVVSTERIVPDRGASAVPSAGPAGGPLRELEVVGASQPGARCLVALRATADPRTRWASPPQPSFTVAAAPELCPLSAGQRIAVSAQALAEAAGGWRPALLDDERGDLADLADLADLGALGGGPRAWVRPSPPPEGLDRLTQPYWRWVATQRHRVWSQTRGDSAASLVAAVGLGLRSAVPPRERDRLRAAGLGHLIAVSGLHVAVASVTVQALLRRLLAAGGGDPRWACVLAWLPLWGYVGLTGAAASAVRAAVMLTGVDLATLTGRPSHGPTLLAVTAAAMLLVVPRWLVDPGFALSIAAMAAIVSAPTSTGDGTSDGARLGPLALSWRITWATAPISVALFDAAPLHGLLANAVALPLFALLMPAALVATLAPAWLAEPALTVARWIAQPILDLAALLAELPSVGPGVLALLAAVALLGHRRARAARAWLPPRLACTLALAVGLVLVGRDLVAQRRPVPRELDWLAVGSVHGYSLLIADASAPTRACLIRPRGSARTWLGLLALVGVEDLASADEPERADPGTAELLRALEAGGVAQRGPGQCHRPDPTLVRAALRSCRARQGGRGRALARAHAGVIDCRIDDRWVVAVELAPPDGDEGGV